MGAKRSVAGILIALFIMAGAVLFIVKNTHAQGGQDSGEVSRKLDEVIANQKTILSEMAALKSEIQIVKIRVTQQQ